MIWVWNSRYQTLMSLHAPSAMITTLIYPKYKDNTLYTMALDLHEVEFHGNQPSGSGIQGFVVSPLIKLKGGLTDSVERCPLLG